FAAYLLAWERMPVRTHISAVFDLAINCVDDIGTDGTDDDTGLGRLDIGCLAYQVTQATECEAGHTLTSTGTCEPVVCPVQTVLKTGPARCERSYESELRTHQYAASRESPVEKAFRIAQPVVDRSNRSAQAYLLHSGTTAQGEEIADLLAGMGIGSSQYTHLSMGAAPSAQQITDRYLQLTSSDLVAFSHAAAPLVTDDYLVGDGIFTYQFRKGAFALIDTGSGGSQDSLAGLATHYQEGMKAAAETGRVHFYYGLNSALSGRHASANGCQHLGEYCIGAPYSFSVELRGGTTKTLAGESSTFAFAAYLNAWERMAENTHISAVFDLALSCVQDIGTTGVDDDTGLGRLDIGCLAYRTADVPVCSATAMLVSRTECGRPYDSYWDSMRGHVYNPRDPLESPLQLAFKNDGIKDRTVDRSSDAYIMDGGFHWQYIKSELDGIGLAVGTNYSLMPIESFAFSFFTPDIVRSYESLSSSDYINASFATDDTPWVTNGPYILNATGNSGNVGWFNPAREDLPVGLNKVHFVYGLHPTTLTIRDDESNGCAGIERFCFGAPYMFHTVGDLGYLRISGTSFSSPFAFAAYLMAWERMAANTHISAVFDMALGCIEDIGAPGPDADTGLGRLDIGCMAYSSAHAPSCHPGYVLTSVRIANCERFSYWEDLQAPLSIAPGSETSIIGESLLVRAFKDVGLQTRTTDRSANTHAVVDTTTTTLAFTDLQMLGIMGVTATVNYSYIPTTANIVSQYKNLAATDLFALLSKPATEFFTEDESQAAGVEAGSITSGAWILSWLRQQQRGNINPLALLPLARDNGVRQAAATGKVNFLYGLNDRLDGRSSGSDGCMHIAAYCIGVPSSYLVRVTTQRTYLSGDVATVTLNQTYSGNQAGALIGFASHLLTWERLPQTSTVSDLFTVVRGCVED
ncbi:MAG: hypothetical protein OXC81_07560, partial [Betaproteobacteria bacterium]|nr:hypothetical protein [Betaproteobacteria bacterium]